MVIQNNLKNEKNDGKTKEFTNRRKRDMSE